MPFRYTVKNQRLPKWSFLYPNGGGKNDSFFFDFFNLTRNWGILPRKYIYEKIFLIKFPTKNVTTKIYHIIGDEGDRGPRTVGNLKKFWFFCKIGAAISSVSFKTDEQKKCVNWIVFFIKLPKWRVIFQSSRTDSSDATRLRVVVRWKVQFFLSLR